MKKIIAAFLTIALATTLAACGAKEEPSVSVAETESVAAATEPRPTVTVTLLETTSAAAPSAAAETKSTVTIAAKDCYGDAGYMEFVAGAETSATYTFAAENCETAEWSVYVLDEAFDDAFRYIGQSEEPVLVGDGTISVNAGQFIYLYCSANELTDITAGENEKLNITVE